MVYNGYNEDYPEKNLIVTVATTGGLQGKSANPNLPEQPKEIAKDVRECEMAGASIAHIHARDESGEHTKDSQVFQEIMDEIHDRCDDILVNFTTGGSSFTPDECIKPIVNTEPKPEMATIDMGPINIGENSTSSHERAEHKRFAETMAEMGVKPELEIFNPGQLTEVNHLIENDLIEPPYFINLIFGMQTGTLPHPRNFMNLVENLPDETEWTCMATGRHQLPMTTMGIILGGHIRIGMEDNIYYRKGELAESNKQLVERSVEIAKMHERPIATPAETRDILGM